MSSKSLNDLLWYISLLYHLNWALASQHCQPFRMAGLVLPKAYLQDIFVQITLFAHIAKTLQFSLIEMSPNLVAYFKKTYLIEIEKTHDPVEAQNIN